MFCRFFVLLFVVFFTAALFGCGAEEEDIILGEEAVVEKWIDPTDVGKEYLLRMKFQRLAILFFSQLREAIHYWESDAIEMKERGVIYFYSHQC